MKCLLQSSDRRGCDGVSHVQDTASLNSISFLWQPLQQGIVSLKINCLSSEFAAKKHGQCHNNIPKGSHSNLTLWIYMYMYWQ